MSDGQRVRTVRQTLANLSMNVLPETKDPIYWASVYRFTAANFWESAKKLLPTLELRDDGTPANLAAIPLYFLVSHAVELLLKSALLKRGYVPSDLRKFDTRHNLHALMLLIEKKNLPISLGSRSRPNLDFSA